MALEDIIAQPPINPVLMQTLGQLQGLRPGMNANLDSILEELGRALMGARQQEATAKSAFDTELAKGPPRTNPMADAIARAMGGAADMFTGRESGGKLAGQTIDTEQGLRLQKRKESLTALEGAYQRAADRASKLGDFETEMKFLTKRDSALKDVENVSKMLMANAEFELGRQARAEEHTNRMGLQSLENQGRLNLSQQEYGQNVALQGIKETGDQRVAYINQGLDPDDPTKQLTGSKASRVRNAAALGFLTTQQWQNHFFDAANKSRAGNVEFKGVKLINRVLNIAPDQTYINNPDGWLDFLLNMQDPNKKDKPLIPRGSDGFPVPAWRPTITAYMKRYYPEWNGAVSAIDSVGRTGR